MITGDQVRAARRLLGWTLFQAAVKAKVSESTVGKFETGAHRPLDLRIVAMQRAFEAAGVEFMLSGPLGVRLRNAVSDRTALAEPSRVA
jgi:transcriptional regulator with XRE-family HTH domain